MPDGTSFTDDTSLTQFTAADDPKTKLAPPPHFVVYSDMWIAGQNGPPDAAKLKGFTVYTLSFLLTSGPADQALAWAQLSAAQRSQIKASYAAAGIKLVVSAFGATDVPTTAGADPVKTADTMATWVTTYALDGLDVDYEDFKAFNDGSDRAVKWLVAFTRHLRERLPVDKYIISHAPVAPWFGRGYAGGGYLAVHAAVGPLINYYNIQFYNQGGDYATVDSLLNKSGSAQPGTSLFEIHTNGVAFDKLVIGKPAAKEDANGGDGYMAPAALAQAVAQAKAKGWNGGVMTWEYPHGDAGWIKTVRGAAFPV
ncbi:glycoside hydrolase family 18 protein [Vararia minispora EC-137]|uniref:Glycoside hydrolase family 18 protein n=1 Tax=Vararia minispora EC-137 TaxID=1314806 RepID=A0ACB8QAN9_9AGAM|nr:glycoside hydrolase family 18 protein [Vararia minispora EC-137]